MYLSIVVPVYKSENTLVELTKRIGTSLQDICGTNYEIIFVEDCGGDNSWQVIEQLKKELPDNIRGIKLSRNFGQHNAILCGFNSIKGDFVITMDDDLQNPPEEIPKLFAKQKETNADLVYAIYDDKKHSGVRNLGSYLVKKVFKIVFNAKPDGSSFRLMRANLVQKLTVHNQNFVFIDGLIHWHTSNIAYQYTEHHARKHGSSNYTWTKLIQLTTNLFFNFTVIPLRIITVVGIIVSILSFLMGLFFGIRKLFYDMPLGYTSLVTSILFSTSLIMISLGVIGEYISRIYMLQNNKPQFSIEKHI